jgi:NhaA family Na+:H+ antiporter
MAIPPRSLGSTTIRATRSRVSGGWLLPAQQYIHNEVVGGVTLLFAALAALAWANSPWEPSYHRFQETIITVSIGPFSVSKNLRHWVNDVLMVLFFFVVGLEIKREFIRGELSDAGQAVLPIAAALGGMVVPALIYSVFNSGGEGRFGWGIPMATDIAFALGVLALLGKRIPSQLRIFLLALATVDDIGAIVVIAAVYTKQLSVAALVSAGLLLIVLVAMVHSGFRNAVVYLSVALLFWLAMLKSGIHATIGGVVLGAIVPTRASFEQETFVGAAQAHLEGFTQALHEGDVDHAEAKLGEIEELTRMTEAPLERLERLIHPWVNYLVLPIFALTNAGVTLSGPMVREASTSPVMWGVLAGLLIGKPVGIVACSWVAVRSGLATISKDMTWTLVIGVGLLGGIGFTVSIFMTGLAFDAQNLVANAKVGILAASLVAGIAGYGFLRWVTQNTTKGARRR